MEDPLPDPSKAGREPTVSPKARERALAEYNATQQRIRHMIEERATGGAEPPPPPPTRIAATRRALDFTKRQRAEMCALYYNHVPIRRIATRFATTPSVIRAIVKMGLIGLSVVAIEHNFMVWLEEFVIPRR